ncbi:MAG: hypothetical protein ACERNK_12480, partial [Deltaproteobacteria bacterium]
MAASWIRNLRDAGDILKRARNPAELVRALAGQGKAILVSSHILSSLSEMIDGVIIIEQGRLLRSGRMHEIQNRTGGCLVVIRPLDQTQEAMQKDLLEMPNVNEIMVVGHDKIYIEKDGILQNSGRSFFSDE